MLPLIFLFACSGPDTYIHGHRGARGLYPENSIPGFVAALDYQLVTLEMDVVISGDSQVVVSHEPWMNADICQAPEGEDITTDQERLLNLFEMDYQEIAQYDCGSLGNPNFPEQQKISMSKPLLSEVIDSVEENITRRQLLYLGYSIELKSSPEGDSLYHPAPETFVSLVHDLIDKRLDWRRVVIQSFDLRILQEWHRRYPETNLVYLIESGTDINENLEKLGFTPAIYSPNYELLTEEDVKEIHDRGMKVVPWTVNEPGDMKRLAAWGVDAIITDYPDRALEAGVNKWANDN